MEVAIILNFLSILVMLYGLFRAITGRDIEKVLFNILSKRLSYTRKFEVGCSLARVARKLTNFFKSAFIKGEITNEDLNKLAMFEEFIDKVLGHGH